MEMNRGMDRTEHGESGVSIVVGVMLMLVVTIILAAVVSSYAGSMITVKEKPLQVNIAARTNGTTEILFDHTGGDQFSLEDLVIILDQGSQQVRITNDTVTDRPNYNLTNKAGISFVRPGDTIVLKGTNTNKYTLFNTTGGSITIEQDNKEFTWILLSRKCDAILAKGSLVFYSGKT
ncbi:MAG: hypothetical protein A4E38_00646 [Methanoregulaceae archaeon PtaB.Bin108]|nr:MAG: hypothetical protein A4E38_00646 [Methanoregulaceae archaeon PtaB.Bin108]OPY46307.1 MAG: hypothetical protein A4E42_00577 [Methanoregulaceae archaeon PtaU1.Bin222]